MFLNIFDFNVSRLTADVWLYKIQLKNKCKKCASFTSVVNLML